MMNEELTIRLSFDKLRFKKTLFRWTAERECSTCEFREQKELKDTMMPVCNVCDGGECWRINEELFDKLLSECTTTKGDV